MLRVERFRVEGLAFRVWGLSLGFGIKGVGCRVEGGGCRLQNVDEECRVQVSQIPAQDSRFKV